MANADGKICYVEIPTGDVAKSAAFYSRVFGWTLRKRGDGATAFDDAIGEVSGTWVLGGKPQENTGILTYIMVFEIEKTIAAITANGGQIVQPVGADAPELTARFKDPAGNVFGLYQQPA